MLRRLLILALCCSLLSCKNIVEKYKRSASGVSALDKKLLYDAREPQISRGGSCVAGPSSCSVVLSNVEGSFTYAAEQEKACLYRCAGSNKLQVFSQNKLQASIDTPYTSIARTFDLNGDDKNEMLLTVEATQNGRRTREASLETIEKGALRSVENFGIVYNDPCALFAGADEAKVKDLKAKGLAPFVEAVRIYYLPRPGHEMPSFSADRLRAPCPADANTTPSDWQVVAPKSGGG